MKDEEEYTTQICTKNREQKRNRVAGCGLRFLCKIYPTTSSCKKYFIFLLTRPQGHVLTLHSLANQSYDYE